MFTNMIMMYYSSKHFTFMSLISSEINELKNESKVLVKFSPFVDKSLFSFVLISNCKRELDFFL